MNTPAHGHLPDLEGVPLTDADLERLEERWINRELTTSLRRVESIVGAAAVGQSGKPGNYAGILIPYLWPGERYHREVRLRRDHPDITVDALGNRKEVRKYLSPPGRGNMLYLAPGTDPTLLGNIDIPIVITEGEFKTLALTRLSWFERGESAELPAFLPMGLSGVWNWRSRTTKANDADGARISVISVIADFSRIEYRDRAVTILFDADITTKPDVAAARRELTHELETRGAIVSHFRFPRKTLPELKGIDDFLAVRGPGEVLQLLTNAKLVTKRKKAGTVVDIGPASEWKSALIRETRGEIRPILANVITALRRAPEWKDRLAFNAFAVRTEFHGQVPWDIDDESTARHPWSDHYDSLTTEWLQKQGIYVRSDLAAEAIETVARENEIHPVREYLNSCVWDGTPRLDYWLNNYIGVPGDDEKFAMAIGARWMISAVARIFRPGCKVDHCLIIEGEQGDKKSSALEIIAGRDWFTDDIADLGSKDSAIQLGGKWIIELGELDSMSRVDVGKVKAFLARGTDHYRPPYARRSADFPRQCIFAGTCNLDTYLKDETGGRRFWPIRCGNIDLAGLRAARNQLWAEARTRYERGEAWWLETSALNEKAAEEQRGRYQEDPWTHHVLEFAEGRTSVTISEALCDLNVDLARQTQTDANRVARIFKTCGWVRRRRSDRDVHGTRAWCYQKAHARASSVPVEQVCPSREIVSGTPQPRE